jgi:hypothetical protein
MGSATNSGRKIFILRTTRAHLSVYDSATMYRVDWTDDRLQERFDSIDHRFDEVDCRFDRVDGDIHRLQNEINTRFDSLQRSFDSLQRTMLQCSVGVIVALIGLAATQL